MKGIIIFLFLLLSFSVKAQFQQLWQGNPTQIVGQKGAVGTGTGYYFLHNFPDTASANLSYQGIFINTTPNFLIVVGDDLYQRNSTATKWNKVNGSSASGTVTSVGLTVTTPASPAFSVSNSPITTSGNLGLNVLGTSSQIILGNGALGSSLPSSLIPTWQQTLDVTGGSVLTHANTITGEDPITFSTSFSKIGTLVVDDGEVAISSSNLSGTIVSVVEVHSDSINIKPHLGAITIDTLTNVSTQNTLMGWVQTAGASRGKVGYITLAGSLSLSSGVLTGTGITGLTVGTTTIASGTTTRILYDNAGVLGEYTLTGTGTVVAMQTSPTFITSIITPAINGGTAANDDIRIQGTTNATRTTSYVTLQENGGFVGIGTTTPSVALDVLGLANFTPASDVDNAFVITNSSTDAVFVVNLASNNILFDPNEVGYNVGIGTTSPDSTFQVSGSLKFVTGRQGAGKVLTSDANGGADWQTPASGGANTALSNLASVAINTSLLPGTDNSIDMGSTSKTFRNLFTKGEIYAGSTTDLGAYQVQVTGAEIIKASSDGTFVQRTESVNGSGYVQWYVDNSNNIIMDFNNNFIGRIAGNNTFGWSASTIVFNSGSTGQTFNIKGSTDANLFFTDATNNRIGIGTNAPSTQLHTTGTVRFANFGAGAATFSSDGTISSVSDKRLKYIEGKYSKGLNAILNSNPVYYKYNNVFDSLYRGSKIPDTTTYIGFIAQDFKKNFGDESIGHDKNGYLSINDRALTGALVNSTKDLYSMIVKQQKKIDNLEKQIKLLKKNK